MSLSLCGPLLYDRSFIIGIYGHSVSARVVPQEEDISHGERMVFNDDRGGCYRENERSGSLFMSYQVKYGGRYDMKFVQNCLLISNNPRVKTFPIRRFNSHACPVKVYKRNERSCRRTDAEELAVSSVWSITGKSSFTGKT